MFGAANVKMAGEEGRGDEAHIAPRYPNSDIKPSQVVLDDGDMAACPPQVYDVNNKTEDLIEAAAVESHRSCSVCVLGLGSQLSCIVVLKIEWYTVTKPRIPASQWCITRSLGQRFVKVHTQHVYTTLPGDSQSSKTCGRSR